MAAAPSPSFPPPDFTVKERVLCHHQNMIYEAKILKVEDFTVENTKTKTTGRHYFVHYKGWKQTWDEWVLPTRLLKWTDENIQTQKALQSSYAASSANVGPAKGKLPKGDGAGAASSARGRKTEARGTKRARDDDDTTGKKQDMKLNVPEALKLLLVDDWEFITKNHQLIAPLPRDPTVTQILEEFTKHCLESPETELREPPLLTPTVVSGIQVYFDRLLGQNLLYRFERPQYAAIRKEFITGQQVKLDGPEKRMSEVYGAEHLLRMLVIMPQMTAQASMDSESTGIIRDYINELLLFMMHNKDRFFLTQYENANTGYDNIHRNQ